MARSYTNVFTYKGKIYHFYIEDGKRKTEVIKDFKPKIGVFTEKGDYTEFITGKPCSLIELDSIYDYYAFVKENQDAIHDIGPEYQFLLSEYKESPPLQVNDLKVFNFDIEVYSEKVFPYPDTPYFPITAITVNDIFRNKFYVFGLKEYTPTQKNVKYKQFDNDTDLLEAFLQFIHKQRPDIITGWNIDKFDFPYIYNRVTYLNSSTGSKLNISELSPVKYVYKNSNKEVQIKGIHIIDYMKLYKKFIQDPRESYALDYIAKTELKDSKLDYQEYDNLADLYNKNYKLYIDYNIKDTALVSAIDKKLKLIPLMVRLAYLASVNFSNVLTSLRVLDNLILKKLNEHKVLAPRSRVHEIDWYPGGHVEAPKQGLHKWIALYDIQSSYPNAIRTYNISNDTLIPYDQLPNDLKKIAQDYPDEDSVIKNLKKFRKEAYPVLKKHKVIYTTNGSFYTREKTGMITEFISEKFLTRLEWKSKEKKLKDKLNKLGHTLSKEDRLALETDIENAHLTNLALKKIINSAYGALASKYFRFFNKTMAAAITAQGRLAIKSIIYFLRRLKNIDTLYGDTDSVFLHVYPALKDKLEGKSESEQLEIVREYLDTEAKDTIESIFKVLAQTLNGLENTVKMEREAIGSVGILAEAKKNYAIKLLEEDESILPKPKLKVRGFEVRKSSTPEVVKQFLLDSIMDVLNGASNSELNKKVQEFKKNFYKLDPNIIGISITANNLEKYQNVTKGVPMHVRASKVYNTLVDTKGLNLEKIQSGEKIKYIFVKVPNELNSDVIAFKNRLPDSIKSVVSIDYARHFERSTVLLTNTIYPTLNWSFIGENSISSLFS